MSVYLLLLANIAEAVYTMVEQHCMIEWRLKIFSIIPRCKANIEWQNKQWSERNIIIGGAIKKFRDFIHPKPNCTLFKFCCHFLQNIPHVQRYTTSDASATGCFLEVKCVQHHLRLALDLHSVKMTALQLELHLGKEEEIAGSQIWRVGELRSDDRIGTIEKLMHFQSTEPAHCHDGAPNCHRATGQVVCGPTKTPFLIFALERAGNFF